MCGSLYVPIPVTLVFYKVGGSWKWICVVLCVLLARLAAALPSAMTIVYEREASRAVREGESHQSCPISLVLSWQKMQLIKKGKSFFFCNGIIRHLRRQEADDRPFSFPILVITLNESNTASAYDDWQPSLALSTAMMSTSDYYRIVIDYKLIYSKVPNKRKMLILILVFHLKKAIWGH